MDLSPLMKLGVTNITISIDFADRSAVQGIADLINSLKAKAETDAPNPAADEPTFYIADGDLYWRAPYKGTTDNIAEAHAYSKSEAEQILITDPGDHMVRTDMPAPIRDILLGDVKSFKNGYAEARDAFGEHPELTYEDEDEGFVGWDRIRKNSRMLREVWKTYYDFK